MTPPGDSYGDFTAAGLLAGQRSGVNGRVVNACQQKLSLRFLETFWHEPTVRVKVLNPKAVFRNQLIILGSLFSVAEFRCYGRFDMGDILSLASTKYGESVYKISSTNADTNFFHSLRCRIQSSL
jgi:hypothetical protein